LDYAIIASLASLPPLWYSYGMSVYWNERVRGLRPYVPGEQPGANERLVKLNTNENPYPPHPAVLEAIRAAADDLRLYPDPHSAALRAALAGHFGLAPENFFVGNGSDEVLAFCFGAFFPSAAECPAGSALLFPDVTYSFYPVYANLWDVPYRAVPVREDFSIDTGAYHSPNLGVIFPNPNAPTALALAPTELLRLARTQADQQRLLIVDEAYCAFGAESVASEVLTHDNLLVVHTFSKAASLAGMRLGYAIGSRPLIEALERLRDSFNSYTVDRLAGAAGVAVLRHWAHCEEVNARIAATRARVSAALSDAGWYTLPSRANFIFTRPPAALGGAEVVFRRLRERGVLVRHFAGARTENFLRVSIGTDAGMNIFLERCRTLSTT
jgi:histidinol-phosphate aminotransferase